MYSSAAENAFVYSLIDGQAQFFNPAYFNTGPWIGAVKAGAGAGNYAWVTGEPFSYTNWTPPEPVNNGDRIAIFGFQPQGGNPAGWDDIPGTQTLTGYLVECSTCTAPPAVPEPSTFFMLGAGLAATVYRRRRKAVATAPR